MSYLYAVRGWLELSWPDVDIEGVDESPEEHARKVQAIRELLTTGTGPGAAAAAPDSTDAPSAALLARYRAGWAFPQGNLDGTEYVFFGGDIEEPAVVLAQIRQVLALDPFADGYFSVEGEDGEQYRQWLIMSGTIYVREVLFPDFEAEGPPPGYRPLFDDEKGRGRGSARG